MNSKAPTFACPSAGASPASLGSERNLTARRHAAPSTCMEPARSSLVIFVDWDDTLFPTSELLAQTYLVDSSHPQRSQLPAKVAQQVREVEDSVLKFLRSCQTRGTVVIVTNAMRGWVSRLTQWCMPRVGIHLRSGGIRVVYARECAASDPDDVSTWKQQSFLLETEAARARLSKPRPLNVVSVGDATFERDAAHAAAGDWDAVTTVKFLEEPSLVELRQELLTLTENIDSVTGGMRSGDAAGGGLGGDFDMTTKTKPSDCSRPRR